MKTRNLIMFFFAGVVLTSFSQKPKVPENTYIVEGIVADSTANGKTIYIRKYDDNKIVGKTIIQNNRFVFTGIVDTAAFCRIDVTRHEYGNFILEPGKITVNLTDRKNLASGTALNEKMTQINIAEHKFRDLLVMKKDSLKVASNTPVSEMDLMNRSLELLQPILSKQSKEIRKSHTDDVIGFYLMYTYFIQRLPIEEKWQAVQEYGPWLRNTVSGTRLIRMVSEERRSQPGQPFINVEGVDPSGSPVSLADYVGKGNYVLVDMWASWCIPCKKQIPYLAKLHERYHDKGLTVLGLFTWDKAVNLKKAIEEEGIIWDQIIEEQGSSMKSYGTTGVPFIFLISPDGTILERDLRGENMITTVEKYMKEKNKTF